jgi:hypothetical protein
MIVFIWFVNLFVSILNAAGCGATWNDTEASGGFPHFLNWLGAIMATCGFLWCFMVPVGLLATVTPWSALYALVGATAEVEGMILGAEGLQALFELAYFVIIGPVIGIGLVATLLAWKRFLRTGSVVDGGVAVYNTLATGHNIYNLASHGDSSYEHLSGFTSGLFDGENNGALVILVIFALCGGLAILTTWWIITRVAGRR